MAIPARCLWHETSINLGAVPSHVVHDRTTILVLRGQLCRFT